MMAELQTSLPPLVNMNNEYAPSVPLPTVPTCKRDFFLQVKIGTNLHLRYSLWSYRSQRPFSLMSIPQGSRACHLREGGGGGCVTTPAYAERQQSCCSPAKIMLHTSATTAGGITR